jgi:hypothetical protein
MKTRPIVTVFMTLVTIIAGATNSSTAQAKEYEIWGSDQSNSVAGVDSPGVKGSWLWIWNSKDVERQIKSGEIAKPLGCDGQNLPGKGPCNLNDIFPSTLLEHDSNGQTTKTLSDAESFGRLHGMLPDPQNLYMNANIFSPKGGYVGIIDGETKEAIALFRVTGSNAGRSVHMSFWNSDGSALLVANLHGKILERIDVTRDSQGKITDVVFNQAASLGVGKNMKVQDTAKVYLGKNSQGKSMLGSIVGSYNADALGNLTPNGLCKEDQCIDEEEKSVRRPNNVIICPIISDNDNAYITFGGGGLLIADTKATPMKIVGEYDNKNINGAGCGGVQVENNMWLNAGVSASGAGANQSTFTVYTIDDSQFSNKANKPNFPLAKVVFKDSSNTKTIGNMDSDKSENSTGQLPGETTRRDAHGMTSTISGNYIHNVDRIQNNVEVFDTKSFERYTYDLTSLDGQGKGIGVCSAFSVMDDPDLPKNDPAPDLLENTPDGKYLVVALRGPMPVSVNHAAQGSCPGVGIIELLDNGKSGQLVTILRSTNTIDTAKVQSPGGYDYKGSEHSDIHGAAVRLIAK